MLVCKLFKDIKLQLPYKCAPQHVTFKTIYACVRTPFTCSPELFHCFEGLANSGNRIEKMPPTDVHNRCRHCSNNFTATTLFRRVSRRDPPRHSLAGEACTQQTYRSGKAALVFRHRLPAVGP